MDRGYVDFKKTPITIENYLSTGGPVFGEVLYPQKGLHFHTYCSCVYSCSVFNISVVNSLVDNKMTDHLTSQHRSWNMSRIKGWNTRPEIIVRSMLHRMGYRFRLHRKDLPGKPDIVLPKHNTVIFVHGCFWHRHPGCRYATTPKSNTEFWQKKFDRNVSRDKKNQANLKATGWRVLVVWECELRDLDALAERLNADLQPQPLEYPQAPTEEKIAAENNGNYST